jgi:hypothetical protein
MACADASHAGSGHAVQWLADESATLCLRQGFATDGVTGDFLLPARRWLLVCVSAGGRTAGNACRATCSLIRLLCGKSCADCLSEFWHRALQESIASTKIVWLFVCFAKIGTLTADSNKRSSSNDRIAPGKGTSRACLNVGDRPSTAAFDVVGSSGVRSRPRINHRREHRRWATCARAFHRLASIPYSPVTAALPPLSPSSRLVHCHTSLLNRHTVRPLLNSTRRRLASMSTSGGRSFAWMIPHAPLSTPRIC